MRASSIIENTVNDPLGEGRNLGKSRLKLVIVQEAASLIAKCRQLNQCYFKIVRIFYNLY